LKETKLLKTIRTDDYLTTVLEEAKDVAE